MQTYELNDAGALELPPNNFETLSIIMRSTLFFVIILLSLNCYSADRTDIPDCQSSLKNLIMPNFKTEMNKDEISLDVIENNNGIHKVRLFTTADNPNKQVSIGWVLLNTKKNSVSDISRDDLHPEKIEVDQKKYQTFINECLDIKSKVRSEVAKDTNLPFSFDKYYSCAYETQKSQPCNDRFHVYQYSDIKKEIRNKIDSEMNLVFFLPPTSGLNIILTGRTETDVNIYRLYAFKDNKLISKKDVGRMDGESIMTFDISKDYLITTYERKGIISNKINRVTHLMLDNSGQFINCSNKNPSAGHCN